MSKHSQLITEAFADAKIIKLANQAIERDSQNLPLLEAIATYHLAEKRKWTASSDEPASKKRKLDNGPAVTSENGTVGAWNDPSATPTATYPGTSCSIPQRKKFELQIIPHKAGRVGGIRATSAQGGIEFGLPWSEIEQIFCLPLPEKAKPQWNFVVIPKGGEGFAPAPAGVAVPEPIVWTESDTPDLASRKQVLRDQLKAFGKDVVEPDSKEFASAIPQPHRKGEKAYHVKAFKGSKDGYLFLLSAGILFAFKKPLLFFPFHAISSISYTSVLQRTFNIIVATQTAGGSDDTSLEIEFSMLDQADYAGIDDYVKRHGLNDASLASHRKAQRIGINDPKKSDKDKDANGGNDESGANGLGEGDDDEGELQKAERMLQDQEDEEEEDYDPGSEGESDGSGSDSDDPLEYDSNAEVGEDEGEEEDDEEEVEEHVEEEDPDEPEGGFL